MKYIGLRFILEYGSFISVVVPEAMAKDIVERFRSNSLPYAIGNTDHLGAWSVLTSSIRGIHTQDVIQEPQQGFLGKSGIY